MLKVELKEYKLKETFEKNKNFEGWPWHLEDIGADIVHNDELFDENIVIYELSNTVTFIPRNGDNYEIRRSIFDCQKDYLDSIKNILNSRSEEDTIFVTCAYLVDTAEHLSVEDQIAAFSSFGFCNINFRTGLENRIPMVYAGTEAGRTYLRIAQKICYDFYHEEGK